MDPVNIKLPMLPIIAVFAALTALAAVSPSQAQSGCILFESPLTGSVFSTPSCTVSLNVTCAGVTRVDLQARYFPENSDSAIIVSLGSISRPPYKLIWNMSNLPNQLFTGVGILAEAAISNSAPQIARQEGIFLTHNPVSRQSVAMPYGLSSGNLNGEHAQSFAMADPQRLARAIVVWNEKELIFYVNVKDPRFDSKRANLTDAGLEILIDPARKRAPHPADSVLFFVVPLSGVPHRVSYRAETADGGFKLVPQSSRVDYQHGVTFREFKDYSVRLSVPREAFGRTIPDTIGCNMVLRVVDDSGHVQKIALVGRNVYEQYSPFTWTDYRKLPKPLLMNAAVQWILFPVAGFLLALAAYLIISKLRKPQLVSNFERSEEEKAAFERINTVIEQDLVKSKLKIDDVALKCELTPQVLNGLIKRNTGFTFANYLQFCRTEVAKERLRSSRSSESDIAKLCGFASAVEMEKCFTRFHRTTPYKFREKQQVA